MAGLEWKTSWTASPQGPYPVGNVAVQPDLDFAFPEPERGAVDQSFRLVLRPDLWGGRMRFRFTNVWGTRPLVLDDVFVGLHLGSAAFVDGVAAPLSFSERRRVEIPPGGSVWSDGAELPFHRALGGGFLAGRRLLVGFRVVGESGPMTWHATAMTTSYVSRPRAALSGGDPGEFAFPFSLNSWFFIDAVDVMADPDTLVIACLGDSITDGSNSTLNGEDRWPDILSRLVHARLGDRVSVINAGIGGNQVVGPWRHTAENPYRGGPAAVDRVDRDLLSLSGVGAVVWLEGINDFHLPERTAASVVAGMEQTARRLRELRPGIRIAGCTVPPALGSVLPDYGDVPQDRKRRELNEFIRRGGLFDCVLEFAEALADPATGGLRPEFVPNSTRGGEGDGLHPNRAGKLRMVESIDVDRLLETFLQPRAGGDDPSSP